VDGRDGPTARSVTSTVSGWSSAAAIVRSVPALAAIRASQGFGDCRRAVASTAKVFF
jgi:hypothetical protein